ncbi:sensor histidine kinase [Alteromonas sediminis]|nr:histidine kinase [Alteromonas sediminis]
MNTFAAELTYRSGRAANATSWLEVWLYYFPWWMPWALLTPLVIAYAQLIDRHKTSMFMFAWQHVMALLSVLVMYLFSGIAMNLILWNKELSQSSLKIQIENALTNSLWHIDFVVYLAILLAGYGLKSSRQAQLEKNRNAELSKQLVDIQLQSLKSQLNPHFLFNTLNTVASLVRLDRKDQAVDALNELSLMLRKVLENQSNQLIPLEQEIEFIQSFLTIQKMRFEDKLNTAVEVDFECLHEDIPFMLLQPLVENAVQHGSQLETDSNLLSLQVRCENGRLLVKLTNKVPQQDTHQGFGIGVKNCRERLRHLYHDDFTLTLTPIENGYFETFVSIPLGKDFYA